jgi:hypothetical protein
MARRLRESDDHPTARVVAWESRKGTFRTAYDADDNKVGRNPTDRSLESADRVVFIHDGDYFTVGALSDDYTLDDAIAELEDLYSDA